MTPTSIAWIFLIGSILTEVSGMIALKYSNGFRAPLPTTLAIFCIMTSLWLISLSIKQLELGITYAIWAAASTALVAIIGIAFYQESISTFKITGLIFIVVGVVLLNLNTQ
jgi:small multidrug resistance pump